MYVAVECISESKKHIVCVSRAVLDTWLTLKQDKKQSTEAFGVLIGGQNQSASQFWIEDCTQPLAKDDSTRTSFVMQDPRHQQSVDKHFEESKGTSGYLGTWHSHPEQIPSPSHVDLKDWHSCCARNSDRNLIFVIVGISHFCIYHRTGTEFKRIYKDLL